MFFHIQGQDNQLSFKITSFRLRENSNKKKNGAEGGGDGIEIKCKVSKKDQCVFTFTTGWRGQDEFLLPLHAYRISLKFHALLAGLSVSFITLAFQSSQSFGCAVIKPCKWLKSSEGAIRCIFVLGIKTGTRLQKCWFGFSRPAVLMVLSTLWYGQVWACPPDHILVLHHVGHWESKSCGEEKKHLVHSLFIPSQWWSTTRSCQCHCNTALVTANQRNILNMVKLLLALVQGWPGPGKGSRTGLPAASGSPLERTAVVQERDWYAGLRVRATTWFIVMWLHQIKELWHFPFSLAVVIS